MAVNVPSVLRPSTPSIPFLMDDIYLRGGMCIVANNSERDSLPAGRRKHGALVYSIAENQYYTWDQDQSAYVIWDITRFIRTGEGIVRDDNGQLIVDTAFLNTRYASRNHNHDDAYATVDHNHDISGVNGLQDALAGKAATSHSHTFSSLSEIPKVSAMPGVHISEEEPSPEDGEDGDIWFVV